ncbi:KilA-N domain-containing protein [Bergeriella denitrificans]|uniref:Putative phage related protein n=1 Tax=Bergeriella denitrificans TaxID=494 RepID=A0A378UHR6_BERDE|nr:KilA-N domain-containing protein [Bergeriella denitrificans]STZ76857.1 putative phage related protein [Bergeriella denitrificans]
MNALVKLDYHNTAIHADREAWFNATEIAAHFGKQVYEWLRLPETERYIAALCKREEEKQANSNTGFSRITKSSFIRSRRGNNGGTWLHPKLAVSFARWCDVDFAVWCDEQITELLTGRQDWQQGRAESKIAFQVMAEILKASRQADGKATAAHHYSNEALLCNAALTGRFAPLERDRLSRPALTMLTRLEACNAALIGQGMPYQQRKAELFKLAEPQRNAIQATLQ